jgi:hypothetical protein
MDPTFPAPSPDDIVSYGMESYRVVALHDRARDAAARAVVGAKARALAALGLDDGAGGRGDGGSGGGRHFVRVRCEVRSGRGWMCEGRGLKAGCWMRL